MYLLLIYVLAVESFIGGVVLCMCVVSFAELMIQLRAAGEHHKNVVLL